MSGRISTGGDRETASGCKEPCEQTKQPEELGIQIGTTTSLVYLEC